MHRYRLPCAVTAAYLLILTGATLYMSTQDRSHVDPMTLAVSLLVICAASALTGWAWRRADRRV